MFEFLNITNDEYKVVSNVSKIEITMNDQSTLVYENPQPASDVLFNDDWISVTFDGRLSLSGRAYVLQSFTTSS
ncbi:hypothetical protein [Fructobacillus cardui]|uniref:Uncharacterized protein n=1 Tax=Fructobacillus cardui TaxID=2893170 RepID=A0ABN9YZ53_9LACO|nr:unnamed protein product [Fructobacillus cardui]